VKFKPVDDTNHLSLEDGLYIPDDDKRRDKHGSLEDGLYIPGDDE